MMSKGIVYVATGKKYIDEANQSFASLKKQNPHIPISFFSSEYTKSNHLDNIVTIENPQYDFIDKILYMYQSPYEYTLFLDTDTYICSDISELFMLLEEFDIAAAHGPARGSLIEGVPSSFPEMNTGVILFKKSPQVEKFFADWLALYEKDRQIDPSRNDQPAFRESLYRSKLRIATLTSEYNCRFIYPTFVSKTVKIIHGRHANLSAIAEEINNNMAMRLIHPKIGLFQPSKMEQNILISLQVLKKIAKKLKNIF